MSAKFSSRPFHTRYYATVTMREHSRSGAAASETGAVRAAVVRVFVQEYEKAVIIDRRTGAVIYTVKRTTTGVKLSYGNDKGLDA